MGFLGNETSFRNIDSSSLSCQRFHDVLGHTFDVTYDGITGDIVELACNEPNGNGTTLVKRQYDYPTGLWTASRLSSDGVDQVNAIPALTKFLADARFDAESGELTLASRSFSKRWVFRTNGSVEFFSASGHISYN